MKQYHPTLYFKYKGASANKRIKLANPTEVCAFPVVAEQQYFDFSQYVSYSPSYSDNAMHDLMTEADRCYKYLKSNESRYIVEFHKTLVLYCDSTPKHGASRDEYGDGSA